LEKRWGDVHHRLVQYSCDRLQHALPPDLRARVEERVFVEFEQDPPRRIIPDVTVYERKQSSDAYSLHERGGVAVAEPLIFRVREPEITEGYIEIRERAGGKVITVIEFLSPANKIGGTGQQKYLEKQREILRSEASLVEIDLVRAGNRVLALPAAEIPTHFTRDYLATISPGWDHCTIELYRMPLRERLPVLPIPLRPDEQRIHLDLQALIDEAYEKGGHDDLNYSEPLDPPLQEDEAGWIAAILRAKVA